MGIYKNELDQKNSIRFLRFHRQQTNETTRRTAVQEGKKPPPTKTNILKSYYVFF